MNSEWQTLLHNSIGCPVALAERLGVDPAAFIEVTAKFPVYINPYFFNLMCTAGPALMRQVVPDKRELADSVGMTDPLAEERDSPVKHLTHRYPDRVLFLVSSRCAVYCRFCTRKRKIGKMAEITEAELLDCIAYIRKHREIKDVLVSGGDPLMLSDEKLEWILRKIREIPHVEVIRIGTRIPSVFPQRVTAHLAEILKQFHPIYVNLHFNHPAEITDESRNACLMLADAGIPLGNQTVLLRGINDDVNVLTDLMRGLLKIRVKPYYLLQGDLTRGTDHFRTKVQTGLDIMKAMRGHVSGLAIPTLVIDLPNGGGKVPLLPEYIVSASSKEVIAKNYLGDQYTYPEPDDIVL